MWFKDITAGQKIRCKISSSIWGCAGPYSRTSNDIQDSFQLCQSQNGVKKCSCTIQSTAWRVSFLETETLANTFPYRRCPRRCALKTDELYHTPDSISCARGTKEFQQMFFLIYVRIQSHTFIFLSVPNHFGSHRLFLHTANCVTKPNRAEILTKLPCLQSLLLLITLISFLWGDRIHVGGKKNLKTHPHTLAHPVGPESPDNRGSGRSQQYCHKTRDCHK